MSHIATIEHLEDYLHSIHPDVLIVNPLLIAPDKMSDVMALLQRYPSLKTIAFCTQLADNAIMSKFHTVANIYTNPSHLVKSVRDITEHRAVIQKKTSENDVLSRREIEILILVAQGLMNKEIAEKLNISLNTVITHRKNIIKKTGIKSVAGLTSYALMHNYINIGG
ncbi:MAG: response regulator transcription factor [Bacteroidales bacterium]|nr:response regulator transcription factor [Bacteroidales bacterium]